MDYSPNQKKIYIKTQDQPSTFDHDEGLPKLPIPTLDETLDKYLASVEPFLTPKQLKTTKKLCRDFRTSQDAQHLQTLLLQRAEVCSQLFK